MIDSLPDDATGVYRALVEHAREPVLAVDRRGEVLFTNLSAGRIFGSFEPDTSRHLFEFVHPMEVDRLRTTFDRALADRQSSAVIEVRVKTDDGEWRLVECMIRGIIDNVTLYGLVHLRDISARRSLETRLRHAQKLTKLGRLTVTLARDLDELINTMRRQIKTMIESAEPQAVIPLSLRALKRAGEAAGAFSRQLMVFSQTTAVVSAPVDLHGMLIDLSERIRQMLGRTVWLSVGLGATRSIARVERENLELAVMDLVAHMHGAMAPGGTIAISTRDSRVPAVPAGPTSSDFIVIEITNVFNDALDAESRLLEPPFDIPDGSMIALGLVLLHDIVTAADGFVEFAARGGVGIVIRVFLPTI